MLLLVSFIVNYLVQIVSLVLFGFLSSDPVQNYKGKACQVAAHMIPVSRQLKHETCRRAQAGVLRLPCPAHR